MFGFFFQPKTPEISFIYISSALWTSHSGKSAWLTATSSLPPTCSVASSSDLLLPEVSYKSPPRTTWAKGLKTESATTEALCKPLLQGCKVCLAQTRQVPRRHNLEGSESTNNRRVVSPGLAENLKERRSRREPL